MKVVFVLLCALVAVSARPIRVVEPVPAENGEACAMCEWVVATIDNWLEENSTEAEIVHFVEKLCDFLPESLSTACDALIEEYGAQIIEMLVDDELQPDMICGLIGLCKRSADGVECALCEWVLGEIEKYITANSTEAQITELVEKACDFLPKTVQSECKALIDKYMTQIIELLLKEEDPETICTQIGLCASAADGVTCALCEWVMSEVESFITKNTTEAEVEAILEKVCNILPKSVQSECQQLIEEYAGQIIDLLINMEPPETICTQIGLCGSYEAADGVTCALCEWVMSEVEKYISANSTEAEIMAALEKVCGLLPKSVQAECIQMVDTYGPQIIDLLINFEDPETICTQIGLCDGVGQNAIPCALCEWVLGEVEKYVGKNSTEEEIKELLEKICDVMPATVKDECVQMVEAYAIQIIELLLKEEPPSTICTQIGLCDGYSADDGVTCALCEWVMSEVEKYISANSTEAEIMAALEKVCGLLPKSVQAECIQMVDTYGPQIIDLLINFEDPETICTQIGLCDGVEEEDGVTCALCEWVMSEVESFITKNTTEAEVEAILEKVCNILPKSVQSECQQLIEEYAGQIIDLLINMEPPETICTQIGLCGGAASPDDVTCALCEWVLSEVEKYITENSTEEYIEKLIEKACDLLPKSVVAECDALVEQYAPEIIDLLVREEDPETICTQITLCKGVDGIECALCEWVMSELEKYVTDNSTEAEIIMIVEKVCSLLPGEIEKACDDFIETYGKQIIDMLVDQVDPEKICTVLGLCASEDDPKDGVECALCEWVVAEIEKFLTENSTESEIIALIEKVCDWLPSSIQKACDEFVELYGPQLIDLLISKEDPDTVCTLLTLCGGDKLEDDGIECSLCEWVLGEIAKYLGQASTEAQITALVEKACVYLPDKYQAECRNLIETYGPQIISFLVEQIQPTEICGLLGLCDGLGDDGVECELCQWVLSEIKSYLVYPATEGEIVALVQKACGYLPELYQDKCSALIGKYGAEIIEWLVEKIDPDQICGLIGLCDEMEEDENDLLCAACEWVMAAIENYISSNSTEAEIEQLLENVCKIVPSALEKQCDELIEEYTPAIIAQLIDEQPPDVVCTEVGACKRQAADDVLCQACEWLLGVVEQFISKNSTEEEIRAVLDKACSFLPKTYADECEQIVDEYEDAIIQLILQEFPPAQVCTMIGLCKEADGEDDLLCTACEWLLSAVEGFISKNSTEEEIKKVLDMACGLLPKSLATQCDQIVDEYEDAIIQLILQEFPPEAVCTEIGLCTSGGPKDDILCAACEWLMSVVEQFISKNSTEEEIKKVLDEACNLLPKSLSTQCASIVDEYEDQIIQLILSEFPPDQICKMIGLCGGGEEKDNDFLCAACEWLMSELEQYITTNSTEEEIRFVLEKACSFLPSTISKECVELVDEYEDAIIELLVHEFPPDVVCTEIGVCKRQSPDDTMCATCEYIVAFIEGWISENTTEAELEKLLDKVCDLVPGALYQECLQMIDTYEPLMIELLLEKEPPETLCKQIGLCKGTSVQPVIRVVKVLRRV